MSWIQAAISLYKKLSPVDSKVMRVKKLSNDFRWTSLKLHPSKRFAGFSAGFLLNLSIIFFFNSGYASLENKLGAVSSSDRYHMSFQCCCCQEGFFKVLVFLEFPEKAKDVETINNVRHPPNMVEYFLK